MAQRACDYSIRIGRCSCALWTGMRTTLTRAMVSTTSAVLRTAANGERSYRFMGFQGKRTNNDAAQKSSHCCFRLGLYCRGCPQNGRYAELGPKRCYGTVRTPSQCGNADIGKVNQWAGSSKTWLKSYSPVPMREAQSYASVAANNNALAYTVWNGTIWEFGLRAKGRRWVATGKVWP